MNQKSYTLVPQDKFTSEHKAFIEEIRNVFRGLDKLSLPGLYLTADINSRYITCTSQVAKLHGCRDAKDMEDRQYHELPFDGAEDSMLWSMNDRHLFHVSDPGYVRFAIAVYGFNGGIDAIEVEKKILLHEESSSILGVQYYAHPFTLKAGHREHNHLLEYLVKYNLKGTLNCTEPTYSNRPSKLTLYEQEVCFFLLLGWSMSDIARYFKDQPSNRHDFGGSESAISKVKNQVCLKLDIDGFSVKDLVETLVAKGLHRELPISLFGEQRTSGVR